MTLLIVFFDTKISKAQERNSHEHNHVGWYATYLEVKLSNEWSLYGEYQWRRDHIITDSKQQVGNIGVNYKFLENLTFRLGFVYSDTYDYGQIPVQEFGKEFPEYRVYQMLELEHSFSELELTHRLMLDQRWIGQYDHVTSKKIDGFEFTNRIRYMIRIQHPIKTYHENKSIYLATYNEILLGFGKNVENDLFDQNRFGLLVGYKVNEFFRCEGGYFYQMAKFGRKINGLDHYQHNSGLTISTYFNL
ncbi:DUF2490 domain-containing protein [Belliella sp. DSM 107340]|uniref:DUF2490 domain-containing protein n=1 Tax=Belliella calami TaxID=2923436 RepID=A0ABS9UK55_9BACT|nr:DUF2490 domain-containing protein [Belliella calami]MCH7397009.1 DUF2490 domain-containing protein [Belliella calami]